MNSIPVVGEKLEYFDDRVYVTRVDAKTFDVGYYPNDTVVPHSFRNRPHKERVDMGNGRLIWNHE